MVAGFYCVFLQIQSLKSFVTKLWNIPVDTHTHLYTHMQIDTFFSKIQFWIQVIWFTFKTKTFHIHPNYYYWSHLYSAILRFRADSLRLHVILHEWIAFKSAFYFCFFNIHRSGVLIALAWLVPHETAAISACSVYTIQPCTMSFHTNPHT